MPLSAELLSSIPDLIDPKKSKMTQNRQKVKSPAKVADAAKVADKISEAFMRTSGFVREGENNDTKKSKMAQNRQNVRSPAKVTKTKKKRIKPTQITTDPSYSFKKKLTTRLSINKKPSHCYLKSYLKLAMKSLST